MLFDGVSIIIPTYNRPKHLYKTLESLGKQNYHSAIEIIIVNDGGCEISHSLLPSSLKCIPNKIINLRCNMGVSCARNRGAQVANYSILGFLDDDTIPSEDWISTLVITFLQNKQIGACVGKIEVEPLKFPLEKLRQSVYEKRHIENISGSKKDLIIASFWGNNFIFENPLCLTDYLSGGNCGIRRDIFMTIGGFDETFKVGQDREIALRVLQHKYYVVYNENLIIKHESQLSIYQLIKGRFRSGFYNALMVDNYSSIHSAYEPKTIAFEENFGMSIYDYYQLYGWQATILGWLSILIYRLGKKTYYTKKSLARYI